MDGDPESVGYVTRPGQLEALANPIRSRILRRARQPITVAELAEVLDVPKTRLYYHVNLLVEEGMLEQVDQRKSGARIEKIYLRTAASYQVGEGLVEAIGDARKAAEAMASVLFDPARAEVEDAFEQKLMGARANLPAEIGRTVVELSAADGVRFQQRLTELMRDLRAASSADGEHTYALTVAFVPIDVEDAIDDG